MFWVFRNLVYRRYTRCIGEFATGWAQQHAEWTRQNWHQVLFTDECRICRQPDNRQRRVWRQSGQSVHLRHTVQRVQQGGGSLMAWGSIMWGWRTPLVFMEGAETAIRYRNDILLPLVQSYRQNFGEEFDLMEDNSRPHHAHLVNEFLHDNIARLEWPACSPDKNPIEHAWGTFCEADVRHCWSWKALKRLYDTGKTSSNL